MKMVHDKKNSSIQRAYENLASAIILKAVYDYQKAIVCNAENLIEECEEFFNSEYYSALTKIDGDTLKRRLREGIDDQKRNRKDRVYRRLDY